MISRSYVWLAMSFFSCSISIGQELAVSLVLQTQIGTDKRVTVSGETNLPKDTLLIISLSDVVTGVGMGQTKTLVGADGKYKSEMLGPLSGLKDGQYNANVTMPIARVQPETVRQVIGNDGEYLKGSLVKKGRFGVTVEADVKFAVGGKDATAKQEQQRTKDMEEYRSIRNEIVGLFACLDSVKGRRLLDDDRDLNKLKEWGQFAREFNGRNGEIRTRIQRVESMQPRLLLSAALGDVGTMFNAAASKNEGQYREFRSVYGDSVKALEAVLGQPEQSEGAGRKRRRTWNDATGRFTIQAAFGGIIGGKVLLVKEDGDEVYVTREQLSKADNEYLDDLTKK